MAILGFKKQFIKPIKKGTKRQTIRGYRKYPIKDFEHLYLYTALRTRFCKKIGEAQCTGTYPISIFKDHVILHAIVDIRISQQSKLNDFAKDDGFESWIDMKAFWLKEHGPTCFPFNGTIIYFNLLPKRNWKK